jgi:hypothetical protein
VVALEFAIAAGAAAAVEGVVELLAVDVAADATGVSDPAGAKLLEVEAVWAAELPVAAGSPVTGWF